MSNVFESSLKSQIYTFIITFLIDISCVMVFMQTYDVKMNTSIFALYVAIIAAIFTILNGLKKRIYAPIVLIVFCAIGGYVLYSKSSLHDGIKKCVLAVQAWAFFTDVVKNNKFNVSGKALAECWSIIMIIPSYLMTFVLQRRKNVFIGLSFFIVLLSISVYPSYIFAKWYWYAIVLVCIVWVAFFGIIRHAERELIDNVMCKLLAPIFIITFIPALIYPMNDYNSQKAEKQFEYVSDVFYRLIDSDAGTEIKKYHHDDGQSVRSITNIVEQSTMSDGRLSAKKDNLSRKGAFVPRNIEVMNITLRINDEEGYDIYNGRGIYLLGVSMSEYDGNCWERGEAPYYRETAETDDSDVVDMLATISITTEDLLEYYLIPSNPGHVLWASATVPENGFEYHNKHIEDYYSGEMYENYDYVYSYVWTLKNPNEDLIIPVITEEYREYLSDTCTYIPDDVENRIIEEVELPDWYIDCYNGELELSDDEKARKVMDYVYNTHKYSQDAVYPGNDDNTDFVTWFLRDSDIGYCVHFSSATAVLLRMLDVPVRYCNGYLVDRVTDGKETTVYDKDAHAWCEFWMDEYGWIQIDPTSNSFIDERFTKYVEDEETTASMPTLPTSTPTPNPIATPTSAAESVVTPTNTSEIGEVEDSDKHTMSSSLIVVLIVIFVLLVVAALKLLQLLYWKQWFESSNRDIAADYLGRYANKIARLFGVRVPRPITHIANKALYSEEGIDEQELEVLRESVRSFTTDTIKSGNIMKRIIAYVFVVVRV